MESLFKKSSKSVYSIAILLMSTFSIFPVNNNSALSKENNENEFIFIKTRSVFTKQNPYSSSKKIIIKKFSS